MNSKTLARERNWKSESTTPSGHLIFNTTKRPLCAGRRRPHGTKRELSCCEESGLPWPGWEADGLSVTSTPMSFLGIVWLLKQSFFLLSLFNFGLQCLCFWRGFPLARWKTVQWRTLQSPSKFSNFVRSLLSCLAFLPLHGPSAGHYIRSPRPSGWLDQYTESNCSSTQFHFM